MTFKTCLAVLAFSAIAFTSAFADTVVLYASTAYTPGIGNPYQNGQGGEFTAVTSGGVPAGYSSLATYTLQNNKTGFETFCVEGGKNDVFFTPGVTYNYTQSDQIIGGPMGTIDLTVGVAWLYSEFATGQLAGYYNSVGRLNRAGELQNAFWTLENEQSTSIAGWISTLLTGQFGSTASAWTQSATASGNTDYGVKVMNLTNNAGRSVQNQLVYTGQAVPDGGMTLTMLGLGLLGLALARRRA